MTTVKGGRRRPSAVQAASETFDDYMTDGRAPAPTADPEDAEAAVRLRAGLYVRRHGLRPYAEIADRLAEAWLRQHRDDPTSRPTRRAH